MPLNDNLTVTGWLQERVLNGAYNTGVREEDGDRKACCQDRAG
jgi:hypothetical protein